MKAFISKRALRAAERISAYWREKADDPSIFPREFLAAIESIESVKGPGSPFRTTKRPALNRVLLEKSRCHIYFEVDQAKQIIRVLQVWDGRRQQPPKL